MSSETTDLLTTYRHCCADLGVRTNSAVIRLLEGNKQKQLQTLSLANNYVGPKGFRPVLELINRCQTIEELDLQSNGLDNQSVVDLCRVLESHLGIAKVNLGRNPISMEAGKALMSLVEANESIIEVKVDNTEIFESLAERLQMAAADNHERVTGRRPKLVMTKPVAARSTTAAHTEDPGRNAKLSALCVAEEEDQGDEANERVMSIEGSGMNTLNLEASTMACPVAANVPASPSQQGHSRSQSPKHVTPALMTTKPKPPPPAVASAYHARLTAEQRDEVRARYRKRAEQFKNAESTQSHKAVVSARAELNVLVRAQERQEQTAPRHPYSLKQQQQPKPTAQEESPDDEREEEDEGLFPEDKESTNDDGTPQEQGTDEPFSTDEQVFQNKQKQLQQKHVPAPPPPRENTKSPDGSPVSYTEPIVAQPLHLGENQRLVVGPEEQFKSLFNMGCRYYNEKNLQAAYTSWNDAMNIAASEKNREWMALLSNNLQTTTYELLISQASTDLDEGDLDGATLALDNAAKVAVKAGNAEWENEISRLRRNVLHARFTKCHESAKIRFEEFKEFVGEEVTDDTRFIVNGQQTVRTQAYVDEYGRMLKIKEAIETWSEAWQCACEIKGSTGALLQQVVKSALGEVCMLLEERYFFCEEEYGATTWQGTWSYSPVERDELIRLWNELGTKARNLNDARWELIAAGQLGNLHFASHNLQKAKENFEVMRKQAESLKDGFLVGCANFYLGVFHLQRSDFSDSERFLKNARHELTQLRNRVPRMKKLEGDGSTEIETDHASPGSARARHSSTAMSATNSDPTTYGSIAEAPASVLAMMMGRVNTFLSRCLIDVRRYREALEAHEASLVQTHHDVLYEKLEDNFSFATLDQLSRVSARSKGPLVYFALHYRYEWNVETEMYDVLERIACWVVPAEGNFKFTCEPIAKSSVLALIDQARHALCLSPEDEVSGVPGTGSFATATRAATTTRAVIRNEPELQWKTPLKQLFHILMHPVDDFISAHTAYSEMGCFTIIPSCLLWLVPFNALLDEHETFLIERFVISFALSGTQLKFTQRASKQVVQSRNFKSMLISQPDAVATAINQHVAFPPNAARAQQEAEMLHSIMKIETITGSSTDVESIPRRIEDAARLHVCAPVLSIASRGNFYGGIAATTSYDQLGILHSESLAFSHLPLQLVTMSNCNITKAGLVSNSEGVLGLTRTLLGAGVSGVVISQWCTKDMKPVGFMEDLYRELVDPAHGGNRAVALASAVRRRLKGEQNADTRACYIGASKEEEAEAARQAKLKATTMRFNPTVWAPFIFIGMPVLDSEALKTAGEAAVKRPPKKRAAFVE